MNRIDGLVVDVDWRRPDDVTEREIDPMSGYLATPYCPDTRTEIYVEGTAPESVCPIHAGSGEPSPFWNEVPMISPETMPGQTTDPAEARRRAEEELRRRQQKENSIRKLLRKIFGDN
jgi:hypothetical protein